MKIILLAGLSILLFSCATHKWKLNYYTKKIVLFQKKYSSKKDSVFTFSDKGFVTKPFNQLTRRDVKKNMKEWEKVMVFIPDSVMKSELKIDSFYTNKNKIIYLKKHKLKTINIHFL